MLASQLVCKTLVTLTCEVFVFHINDSFLCYSVSDDYFHYVVSGEDGPSQMGLEDLGMFRAIPGSTVFYPSDAVSAERAVELAANTKGICYIRTSRPNVPILYDNGEEFHVGKAKV